MVRQTTLPMSSASTESAKLPQSWFVTTHWTVVVSARAGNSADSEAALEKLCRAYWYPLYAYVRRQGHSPHDAEDLTQEFFGKLLHADYLKSVAREKGRFRTFLLVALKRFLANEWDRSRAQKRGGRHEHLPVDISDAESRYAVEPAAQLSADRIYDRRWALTLLERTMSQLRAEFSAAGKAEEFERMKVFLTAEKGGINYASVAAELKQSEGALRVAIHRLRSRFRELFREGIAHTVSGPKELEAETRHLFTALSD
jgi:RNA polymerase sigma factor (sigma-70 family)